MLKRALEFKVAFDKMELEDKLYNDHFMEIVDGKKRIGPPSVKDLLDVERLNRFLLIFYNASLVVSASTTLNAHKVYGEIVDIESNLQMLSTCNSGDNELKVQANKMIAKFDKYWDGFKNINKMLIVAIVFDPRKKMNFAKMCWNELYGEESTDTNEMIQLLELLLQAMFKEYSDSYNKKTQSTTSSQSQTLTTSSQSQSQSQVQAQDNQADFVDEDELGYRRLWIDKRYNSMLKETGVRDKNELETYLKEKCENPDVMMGMDYDELDFWKLNSGKYPILSEMARDLLAMQVSSVASESAFSTSGRIITPFRSCLTPYMVEVLI